MVVTCGGTINVELLRRVNSHPTGFLSDGLALIRPTHRLCNQIAQSMRSTFNEEQKVLISLNSLTYYID